MARLGRRLGDLIDLLSDLSRVELQALGRAIIVLSVVPVLFLILAIFLGAVMGDVVKKAFLALAMSFAAIYFWWIAFRRFSLGFATIFLFTVGPETPPEGTRNTIGSSALTYLRFSAMIVTSELAIGMILFFVPVHNNPIYALVLVPLTIFVLSFALWNGGSAWWPTIISFVLLAGFGWVLFTSFLPSTSARIGEKIRDIDEKGFAIGAFTSPANSSAGLPKLCGDSEEITLKDPANPTVFSEHLSPSDCRAITIIFPTGAQRRSVTYVYPINCKIVSRKFSDMAFRGKHSAALHAIHNDGSVSVAKDGVPLKEVDAYYMEGAGWASLRLACES